jgi:cell division protease FtsH
LPEEDKYLKTKKELLDNITQLLGGRVSEEMNFEDITSGAQNDLERSTKLARKMVTEFGMSSRLGPVTYKIDDEEVFLGKEIISRPHYSEEIASEIDKEVNTIISGCYEKARQILLENRDALTMLADKLMEKETLLREEVMNLLFNVKSHKKVKESITSGMSNRSGENNGSRNDKGRNTSESKTSSLNSGDSGKTVQKNRNQNKNQSAKKLARVKIEEKN